MSKYLKLLALSVVATIPFSDIASATTLTFDTNAPPVSDFEILRQDYGDRVSGANTDATGTGAAAAGSYSIGSEGTTENVVVDYVGGPGADPSLWTTGYGDLSNVYFNDLDANGSIGIQFTADAGFAVTLESFEMADYLSGGQTVSSIEVFDANNMSIWSLSDVFITGDNSSHIDFDNLGLTSSALFLTIALDFGGASDEVGLDNVVFSQSVVSAVPIPAALPLFGTGLAALGFLGWRKKRKAA